MLFSENTLFLNSSGTDTISNHFMLLILIRRDSTLELCLGDSSSGNLFSFDILFLCAMFGNQSLKQRIISSTWHHILSN